MSVGGQKWGELYKNTRDPGLERRCQERFLKPWAGFPDMPPDRWVVEENGEIQTHIPASEMPNNPWEGLREPTGTGCLHWMLAGGSSDMVPALRGQKSPSQLERQRLNIVPVEDLGIQ